MPGEPFRVFISSAIRGFEETRQAAVQAVADLNQEGLGLAVLRSEDLPALAASPQEACLEAARRCDLYLGVFGGRYSAPTAEEYAEARDHGKPCLIFIEEGGVRESAQEEFLSQLHGWAEGHFLCTFKTPDDLKYQVARALRRNLVTSYLRGLVGELARLPLAPMEEGSVATGDLVRIELLDRVMKKDKEFLGRIDLEEAMRRHPRLLIVGPGGSGKSTALWRLAFDLASQILEGSGLVASGTLETPVPVLLRLSRYNGDLLHNVAETLSMGIHAAEASMGQGRIVLLLDGFDELSQKRRLLEDLEQLVRRAPSARYVLTSRPDPALSALQPSVAIPVDLAPLEEAGVANLLTMHLGADGAERLLHSLEDRGLIDPFRLPLMAWLATVAFRASGSTPLPIATGALYERVLGDFFKKWESRRSESLVDRKIDLKIECLASLGKEMVRLETTVLARTHALALCQTVIARSVASRGTAATEPAQLLEELEVQSLLGCSERGIEFWHLSLRDHFAAIWLSRHAKPWKVALLARRARWKEPVIHLTSMLDESRSRDLLNLLLRLTPVAFLGCALHPVGWAADWIFLVLRCLLETPYPCDDLKDRFLDRIRNRDFYLSGARAPVRSRGFGDFDVYLKFHSLIGQFGTNASFNYLRQVAEPQLRITGLGQFRNAEAAAILLAEFEGSESRGLTTYIAAGFLLRFPSAFLLEKVEEFFHQAEPAAKARLLSCLAMSRHEGVRLKLKERERWCDFVAEIALSDADTEVRSAACSFARSLEARGGLPSEVEKHFLKALASDEESRKYNAVWPLVYSDTVESCESLVNALDDKDPFVRLRALDALRIRDRERFPDHAVAFLKRLELNDSAAFAEALAGLVVSFPQVDPASLEKALWLFLGTRLPLITSIRVLAAEALANLALGFTAPWFAEIFAGDEEERLREEALRGLVRILGEEALPYLLQGLASPAARVREAAIFHCRDFTGEAAQAVLPKLQELVAMEHRKMKWVVERILEKCQE